MRLFFLFNVFVFLLSAQVFGSQDTESYEIINTTDTKNKNRSKARKGIFQRLFDSENQGTSIIANNQQKGQKNLDSKSASHSKSKSLDILNSEHDISSVPLEVKILNPNLDKNTQKKGSIERKTFSKTDSEEDSSPSVNSKELLSEKKMRKRKDPRIRNASSKGYSYQKSRKSPPSSFDEKESLYLGAPKSLYLGVPSTGVLDMISYENSAISASTSDKEDFITYRDLSDDAESNISDKEDVITYRDLSDDSSAKGFLDKTLDSLEEPKIETKDAEMQTSAYENDEESAQKVSTEDKLLTNTTNAKEDKLLTEVRSEFSDSVQRHLNSASFHLSEFYERNVIRTKAAAELKDLYTKAARSANNLYEIAKEYGIESNQYKEKGNDLMHDFNVLFTEKNIAGIRKNNNLDNAKESLLQLGLIRKNNKPEMPETEIVVKKPSGKRDFEDKEGGEEKFL
jgi:transcription termination factor NusB